MNGETSAARSLRRILRTSLIGAAADQDVPDLEELDWGQLVAVARAEALSPLLFRALKDLGAPWQAPAHWQIQLYFDYSSTVRNNLIRFREAATLLAAFEREHIPVIVMKGAALANGLYTDIGLRWMGDLDLLVHPEDQARVDALMVQCGYAVQPEPTTGFRDVYSSEQVYVRPDSPSAVVEVHWHIFNIPYYWQRISMNWFWQRIEPVTVGGHAGVMFDPDAQLLHLVAHYALQHQASGVRWLYDVALLLAHCGERIHWEAVCRAASEFGIACALLHTLEEVVAVWRIPLPSASLNPLGSLHPSYRERAIFSTLTIPQRGVAIIWHALTAPGARNKVTFLAHRVFPTPAYMINRYQLASTRALPEAYVRRLADGGILFVRSLGPLVGSFSRVGRIDP